MSDRSIDSLIEAVLDRGVAPLVKRLEKDLRQSLVTSITVFSEGVRGPEILMGRKGDDEAQPDGELRLKIRKAYGQHRYLYSLESVYRRDLSKTGFSGFSASGEILISPDGCPEVIQKNWAIQYNVWVFMERYA